MIPSNNLVELIERYNVKAPRYTSYPTAVQFTSNFDRQKIELAMQQMVIQPTELSLYVHLPFCRSLCWYCGCTRVITKQQVKADEYLDYLEQEIKLQKLYVNPESLVRQIHFGGGTPNFLDSAQLERLGRLLLSNFRIVDDVEFSVELDPRTLTGEQVIILKELGCNRASLGIQDINASVQKAIHRVQPMSQNFAAVELLRKYGIQAINLDLIYGLPEQTFDNFSNTLQECLKLEPNRLAIYSYAHLPNIMPAQRHFKLDSLPLGMDKIKMLTHAVDFLTEHRFVHIGMDHFARSNDALSLALESKSLHRNFQGYSTLAGLEMLALGMSAISERSSYYFQNSKELPEYYKLINQQQLPFTKALKLTEEDKIRGGLIAKIMCSEDLEIKHLSSSEAEIFNLTIAAQQPKLQQMQVDQLIEFDTQQLKVTKLGRLFLRNIANLFDQYNQVAVQAAYSQAV